MTEDDMYRSSTQYRVWSYTPESLKALRATTNKAAAERVVAAIQRHRAARAKKHESALSSSDEGHDSSHNGTPNGALEDMDEEIECLTADEELKLLEYYSEQCLKIGDSMKFPTNVKATAVQYLKRFYLSNSLMTYHPRDIVPTCLFLATKTENNYISLSGFAAKYPKKSAEQIIAPEFILTQGLRFTFDVRHPHRGLRGGLLELLAMSRGTAAILPGIPQSPQEIQTAMLALSLDPNSTEIAPKTPKALEQRCGQAHDHAKDILSSAALLTDAYFHYTPAQIWLAALLLADEPLAFFYLDTKFPTSSADSNIISTKTKAIAAIRACASMLSARSAAPKESRDQLVRIDKKLYQCQNPDKRNLVRLHQAQKRGEPAGAADMDAEHVAKKRKMERERGQKEGDDVFGAPLPATTAGIAAVPSPGTAKAAG